MSIPVSDCPHGRSLDGPLRDPAVNRAGFAFPEAKCQVLATELPLIIQGGIFFLNTKTSQRGY